MNLTDEIPVLHIYTRVSTTAQEEQGTSLSSQEKLGRERAEALGFGARVWNEGGKSSNHEEIEGRPVLKALVNEIANGGAKHVFVYDQSRLSRNDNVASAIRYQCKKNGVIVRQAPKGYKLRKGRATKAVLLKMEGSPGKRSTPVGKDSITVE